MLVRSIRRAFGFDLSARPSQIMSTGFALGTKMTIELLAAVLAIIATIVSATLVLAAKLTVLEVAIARLQVTMAQFESRIAALEKWRDV